MGLRILGLLGFVCAAAVLIQARSRTEVASGDYSVLYTKDNYTYDNFVLEVLESDYIVFKVKACSDAHVGLIDDASNKSRHMIEVVLSGWENTYSVIRVGMQGSEYIGDAYTPHLLHCGEYRQFWVHWSPTHFLVGRGPVYLEQEFMRADRTGGGDSPRDFPINFVSFCTGFGHSGTWEIQENVGYHLMVHTPDVTPEAFEFVTKQVTRKAGFYKFRARACNDVHVAMGPSPGNWKWRINLCAWGNTVHCVWYAGQPTCSEEILNVCSCDEERFFWVSWLGNEIKAGQGTDYEQNSLINYVGIEAIDVDFLSFSTGWGATGYWIFDENTENSWEAVSRAGQIDDRTYNMWLITAKRHFVPFHVMACQEARLAISDKPAVDSELDAYHIILGAEQNTKTVVQEDFVVGYLYEVATPDILDCNMTKPFWLSYRNNIVEMGHGLSYEHFKFMEWQIPREDFNVQSVGLSLPADEGFWTIKRNHADGVAYETPPSYIFHHWWMTVRDDYIVYFRVKGERNAHVLLKQIIGYTAGYHTEVVIGDDNQETFIRETDKAGESSITVLAQTPEVLSSEEFRGFWICWLDGHIKVGAGFKYDPSRMLIEAPQINPYTINGMAISSDDVRLQWEFESNSGEIIYMRTPTGSWDNKWLHMFDADGADVAEGGYWFYFQAAGIEATLVLSQHYHDDSNSYRFGIGEDFNTRISLYRGNNRVAEYREEGILHQDEMRTFWVSWTDGRIKMGKGPYKDSNVMIDYGASGFDSVLGVAVAGTDEYVAYWRFYQHQGVEEFSFDTNRFLAADQVWVSLTRHTHLVFAVQACHSVNIFLAAIMHSTDPQDNYRITIQDTEGMTSIWAPFLAEGREAELKKRVEVATADLLSCDEERIFWVSFTFENTVGSIVLGKGSNHGMDPIVSYHDFDNVPIRAISFTTEDTTGLFRVPMASVGVFANLREPPSDEMSTGAIVGAAFGFLALIALFVVAVVLIMRPPASLQKYLTPQSSVSAGMGDISRSETAKGFDNPLSVNINEAGYD